MEFLSIFNIGEEPATAVVKAARQQQNSGNLTLSSFGNLPAAMLFAPNEQIRGSLHYMFFPPGKSQQFHYHPGDRYLVLVGDIDIRIKYSLAGPNDDPLLEAQEIVAPKNHICAMRFAANTWHMFSTLQEAGNGVVAFSFHGDDEISGDNLPGNLMEELTVFHGPQDRHPLTHDPSSS